MGSFVFGTTLSKQRKEVQELVPLLEEHLAECQQDCTWDELREEHEELKDFTDSDFCEAGLFLGYEIR